MWPIGVGANEMAMELVAPRPAGCGTAIYPPSDSDDDDLPSLVLLPKDRANAVARHVSRVRGTDTGKQATPATPASPDEASPARVKCCVYHPSARALDYERETRKRHLLCFAIADSC